jgi:Tol biopolymer transport system component
VPGARKFISLSSCGAQYVLFENHTGNTIELMRTDADGSNPTRLAQDVLNSDCSPDGEWVLYSSGTKLFRVPVEGGAPTEIVTASQRGAYGMISPDGRSIAYGYLEGTPVALSKVAVAPAAGGSPLQVFTRPAGANKLRWSGDGKGFQYLLTRDGASKVWEQPLSGGPPRQITNFASGVIFDFAWSSMARISSSPRATFRATSSS